MSASAPPRSGEAVEIQPDLRVVLAPNPSPMTGAGTNSYLIGAGDVALVDPGPDDPRHLAALLRALRSGDRIAAILVTHAHADHSPLARRLSAQTGAPMLAFGDARAGRSSRMAALGPDLGGGEGVDAAFVPDRSLACGDTVSGRGWTIAALHTPGHMGNHLCFRWGDVVFSGDHVMDWASTLVSPPDGDMTDYMTSLDRLEKAGARRLLPGHGAPVEHPAARISVLRAHRLDREAQILDALGTGPADCIALAARLYTDTPVSLHRAASRNVLAHLIDLQARGRVAPVALAGQVPDAPPGPATCFRRL